MKLLEILAKLGILRYGVKSATWTSGKDMPAEMLMDDVFNAERDLTTKADLKELFGSKPATETKFCTQCGKPLDAGAKFCTHCGAAAE